MLRGTHNIASIELIASTKIKETALGTLPTELWLEESQKDTNSGILAKNFVYQLT